MLAVALVKMWAVNHLSSRLHRPTQWTGLRGGLGAAVFTLEPQLDGIGERTVYDCKCARPYMVDLCLFQISP